MKQLSQNLHEEMGVFFYTFYVSTKQLTDFIDSDTDIEEPFHDEVSRLTL